MSITSPACIPDRKTCIELMDRLDMLPHIRRHSLVVSRVAISIAQALNSTGMSYDIPKIEAAALLHDITKTKSLVTGENHAITGANLLMDLGYTSLAAIVREHVEPQDHGDTITEQELVSYADKRVLHDTVVDTGKRFAYLLERYGRNETAVRRITAMRERTEAIERKIMNRIPHLPRHPRHKTGCSPAACSPDSPPKKKKNSLVPENRGDIICLGKQ